MNIRGQSEQKNSIFENVPKKEDISRRAAEEGEKEEEEVVELQLRLESDLEDDLFEGHDSMDESFGIKQEEDEIFVDRNKLSGLSNGSRTVIDTVIRKKNIVGRDSEFDDFFCDQIEELGEIGEPEEERRIDRSQVLSDSNKRNVSYSDADEPEKLPMIDSKKLLNDLTNGCYVHVDQLSKNSVEAKQNVRFCTRFGRRVRFTEVLQAGFS